MPEYCASDNFEILPGLWTHNLTKSQVEADPAYGCCQKFICSLACPKKFDDDGVSKVFGSTVVVFAAIYVIIGLVASRMVKGKVENFFVCDRSLPFYVVLLSLCGQGLDSNATLGNATFAYKFHFWDGAVLPLGLAISLLLNGIFLAPALNRMRLLTLPDLFGRKYGKLMEIMVSLIELVSFTFLLAGNLVGISFMMQFMFGLSKAISICVSGGLLALYTCTSGLYGVTYPDVLQASLGFSGLLIGTIYMMVTEDGPTYAPKSLGFALPITNNLTAITPGFKGSLTCSDPITNASTCDNYAYPIGDKIAYSNAMSDKDAYAPFPNAIVFNWATLIVLSLGNLCALDFQARSMASRTPKIARWGNIGAGILLLIFAFPFSFIGGLMRKYYGPDSVYAEFAADTCSLQLGLPSCAQWEPDETSLFKLLWEKYPRFLGTWTMVAIISASMSTCDGAILATSTVAANNIVSKLPWVKMDHKLWVTRAFIAPMTAIAMVVASLAYNPGYLLVVAFDVVVAGVFFPLILGMFWKKTTPNAGIISCLSGTILRLVLELTLPKDGSNVLIGKFAYDYGKAIPGLPSFMETLPAGNGAEAGVWDTSKQTCSQEKLADWTGVDSLVSPAVCLFLLVTISLLENATKVDLLFFIPRSWRTEDPNFYTFEHGDYYHGNEDPSIKDVDFKDDTAHGGREAYPLPTKTVSAV